MTTSTDWNDLALWMAHMDWPTAVAVLVVVGLAGFVLGYISGLK